jgi:hypothetical protein
VGFDGNASVGMELLEKALEFTAESGLFEDAPQCNYQRINKRDPSKSSH